MPSRDIDQEWSGSAETVLPWAVVISTGVRFGKVDIVQYDAGPARRIHLTPRDSVLEMLLPAGGGRIERSGQFDTEPAGRAMGDAVFLPAHHAVTIDWPATGPLRAIRCHYQVPESYRAFSPRELIAGLAVNSPALTTAVQTLAHELMAPGFQSSLLAESLAAQVAVGLGRYLRRDPRVEASDRLSPGQMAVIDQRIEAGTDVPQADELARLCHLSRRHFFRLFRQTAGMTPTSYVAMRQVERAQRMLLEDGAAIKRIAHDCGFKTASGFSAAFRRATGMTPRAFQIAPRR